MNGNEGKETIKINKYFETNNNIVVHLYIYENFNALQCLVKYALRRLTSEPIFTLGLNIFFRNSYDR